MYSSEFCFTIESCFLIKNFPHNIASIHLRYSLSAEVFPGGRRVSRIRFGDGKSNATHISEKTVVVERSKLTGNSKTFFWPRECTGNIEELGLIFRVYRQQPSPLLYSIDIWPARNSRLTQRETNHYITRCANELAWPYLAGRSPGQLVIDLFARHQRFAVCCQ